MRKELLILCFCTVTCGVYLPGMNPVDYCPKEEETEKCKSELKIFVNALSADYAGTVPIEYHNFDFCVQSEAETSTDNIGQILFGKKIRPSNYKLEFGKDIVCSTLCEKTYKKDRQGDAEKIAMIKEGIRLNYHQNWIIDNMPVTFCLKNEKDEKVCRIGFPMGCFTREDGTPTQTCVYDPRHRQPSTFYLYNHIDITIEYRNITNDHNFMEIPFGRRITSISAIPKSIKHSEDDSKFIPPPMAIGPGDTDFRIVYTYSVTFREIDHMKWSTRWDYLLHGYPNTYIEWFKIIGFLTVCLIVSITIALLLLRSLYSDISQYNQFYKADETQKGAGWSLIQGDVFRPPRFGMLLSVFLGVGSQLIVISLVTMVCVFIGFLKHKIRGTLMLYSLLISVCSGPVAGYVSSRIYRMFGGVRWYFNILLTSLLVPCILFSVLYLCNWVMMTDSGSSAAMESGSLVKIFGMWMVVSTPITFFGTFYGFQQEPIQNPLPVKKIARQIPNQPFFSWPLYTSPLCGMVFGGFVPFMVAFIHLHLVFSSLWGHHFYAFFACFCPLFISFFFSCSEASIVLCYYHLCNEDYRWWWRSFLTGGSTGVYFYLFCFNHYFKMTTINSFVSAALYFSYIFIGSFLLFLLTGTIGFFACFFFVRRIYGSIKH